MGGSVALISSVIGLMSDMQQPEGPPDNSAQLAEERKAKEAEQTQREADERRRNREKVTEARQLEKKRLAPASNRQTTLAGGGTGLTGPAKTMSTGLKAKLGE